MFYKASIYIADILEQQNKFTADDKELYRYGIQQGLNLALNILTTLIIGCLCGMFYSSVLFLVSYMPLRSWLCEKISVNSKTVIKVIYWSD